jgi:hypothetical protein
MTAVWRGYLGGAKLRRAGMARIGIDATDALKAIHTRAARHIRCTERTRSP